MFPIEEGPRQKVPGRLDLCRRTQAGGGRALRLLSRQVGEDRRSKQAGTVELQVAALPVNPLELSVDTSMTLYSFINLKKVVHIACTLLFTRHRFLWQSYKAVQSLFIFVHLHHQVFYHSHFQRNREIEKLIKKCFPKSKHL